MQQILQEWDGVVVAIGGDTFTAHLADRASDRADSEAEIPINILCDHDRSIVDVGCLFSLSVGQDGDLRIELIQDKWTEQQISRAEEDAAQLFAQLHWE